MDTTAPEFISVPEDVAINASTTCQRHWRSGDRCGPVAVTVANDTVVDVTAELATVVHLHNHRRRWKQYFCSSDDRRDTTAHEFISVPIGFLEPF